MILLSKHHRIEARQCLPYHLEFKLSSLEKNHQSLSNFPTSPTPHLPYSYPYLAGNREPTAMPKAPGL